MYKETAVQLVPRETIAHMKNGADNFAEYITDHITHNLAKRVSDILCSEGEIVIRQSDVRVSEYIPTNSVEYRREVMWGHLVRCNDCEYYTAEEKWCRRLGLCGAFDGDGYCSHGERRKDEGVYG